MKFFSVDFEFNGSNEAQLNLVSCAYIVYIDQVEVERNAIWLRNNEENKELLRQKLLYWRDQGAIFFAWMATAEAKCFLSLGLDVKTFKFIDLMLEYRCLTNSNDNLQVGMQLVDGVLKESFKKLDKYKIDEERPTLKTPSNLVSGIYKLLGIMPDVLRKEGTRDLILGRGSGDFTEEEQVKILDYNMSDVIYLNDIYNAEISEYCRLLGVKSPPAILQEMMLFKGKYAARTAIMESLGYPICVESARILSLNIQTILDDMISKIVSKFPDINPFRHVKWKDKNTGQLKYGFIPNTKNIQKWVLEKHGSAWPRTKKSNKFRDGQITLSAEAFGKFYKREDKDYSEDCFGSQYYIYLTAKSNLSGFIIKEDKDNQFWSYVGSDGRARPYLNIYGAQTGRTQAKSNSFIPAKPKWLRSLIQPKPGKIIVAADWKSQEFLVSGLMAHDQNMVDAYNSGDVYFYLAKKAGAVPPDGDKKTYRNERAAFKQTTLALSYLMTKKGLAPNLSNVLGREVSECEAQKYINFFNKIYPDAYTHRVSSWPKYIKKKRAVLGSGWAMWGDNIDDKSVTNFPIQGTASDIMKYAAISAQDAGLDIIFTLHDALYIEFDDKDFSPIDTLCRCMDEAFKYVFRNDPWAYERANAGIDVKAWGPYFPDCEPGEVIEYTTPAGKKFTASRIHVDEHAADEYIKFKQYFETLRKPEIPREFEIL